MRQIWLSICLIFFLGACYNNAHLRTQKVLKTDEKIYSGSTTINISDEIGYGLQWPGVLGIRGEGSMLIGKPWGEMGLFGGLGFAEEGPGYIFGLDYRRYRWTKNGTGLKIGGQAEVNITPRYSDYQTHGYAIQFRPSISTITSIQKNLYGGIHGLYSMGQLTDLYGVESYTDSGWWEWIEKEISYSQITYGFGAMAGLEFLFKQSSIQFEIDASIIRGKSYVDEIIENDYMARDFSTILVSGSAGLNFFKPEIKRGTAYGPYPKPTIQQKHVEKKQVRFDPITGKEIKENFGNKKYDPLTGKPIQKPENQSRLNPVFLGGIVSNIADNDGEKYKRAKLQSVTQDQLTFTFSKRILIGQGKSIFKNTTQVIALDKIQSMTIYDNQTNVAGGLLGCFGGCVVGYITPLILSVITDVDELGVIILVTWPAGMIYGWKEGQNKKSALDISFKGLSAEKRYSKIVESVQSFNK